MLATMLAPQRWDDLVLNTPGLVSHWCMDSIKDRKSTNHGSYVGTVGKSQQGPFQSARSIKPNGAAGDYVSIPDDNSLDYGDGPVTFEALYRFASDAGTYTTLFWKGSTGGIHVTWNGSGATDRWEGWTSANWLLAGSATLALSGWHLLHMQKLASTTRKVWIDGVDISGTLAAATASNNAIILAIGGGAFGFPGWISEASLYAAILSPVQILNRWQLALELGLSRST